MNTVYLTVILSMECFIRDNLSVFCQKLHDVSICAINK